MSLITLGVADLPSAVNFYERVVGGKPESSPPGVVFFDLNGLVFALWPHEDLVKDLGMTAETVPAYRGYTLAYNFLENRLNLGRELGLTRESILDYSPTTLIGWIFSLLLVNHNGAVMRVETGSLPNCSAMTPTPFTIVMGISFTRK